MPTKQQPESTSSGDGLPSLASMLRAKDPEAGTRLNAEFHGALIRFCWGYLGQLDRAEDAVQDVCFKVLRAEVIPNDIRPWVYRIARNHCLNLLRERGDASLPPASQIGDAITGQLTRLAREEMHERLAQLVRSLSTEQSEALRLRYVENLSRAEIADVLEVPTSVVKSRIFEALRRLRGLAAQLDET